MTGYRDHALLEGLQYVDVCSLDGHGYCHAEYNADDRQSRTYRARQEMASSDGVECSCHGQNC